jgi:SAM-dependent methyltransferase
VIGSELIAWLAAMAPGERDAAVEAYLGISQPVSHVSPADHLHGYQPSGVAPIVQTLLEVPVTAEDVVIDLGAGLGKVVLLARLLTGARARGIEVQSALVDRSRSAARRLNVDVDFVHGDAREVDLSDGTVFYLYLPCTGPALESLLARLHDVARRRAIVVCALGLDLDRFAPWLARRPLEAFWLTIYDSIPRRPSRAAPLRPAPHPLLGPLAEAIAKERGPGP